jgi:hypothetical protein
MIKKESSKQMRIMGEVPINFTKEEISYELDGRIETHPITTNEGRFFPYDFIQIKDGLICHYTFDYNKTSVSDALLSKNPNRGILIQINDDGTGLVQFPSKKN